MHNRNTLHKNQLPAFREWLLSKGWREHPIPASAIYQVLRITSPSHPRMEIFYAKLEPTAHITTTSKKSLMLVHEFIRSKKESRRA